VIQENEYVQTVQFMSKLNGQKWILTNIYAPCSPDGKLAFLRWFKNVYMPDDCLWIIMGNFNLIRRPKNRNKPGGDSYLMQPFNDAISKLGLIELPLSRQQFTWINSQQNPLLERLDWVFVSQSWSLEFPISWVKTLTRDTFDHVPCAISFKTEVPKTQIFRFENFWMEYEQFNDVLIPGIFQVIKGIQPRLSQQN
jgi:hypothetical protein